MDCMEMDYTGEVIFARNDVTKFKVKQKININDIFLNLIFCNVTDNCLLLDIGTGNGFVLSQISEKTGKQVQLYGVDNSEEMVKIAKKNLEGKAKILQADINNLPFDNNNFNVVTAKNVTRINASEIFRVLKDGGVFIFREYGYGKGLVEVVKLFNNRIIRQRNPKYYVKNLTEAGFIITKFKQFKIFRKYNSAQELISIVKSFPLIQDFSIADETKILKRFEKDATITSDPFILVANKIKGGK
mgnify:CR=1 FL=1